MPARAARSHCHPSRKHKALDLCGPCYQRWRTTRPADLHSYVSEAKAKLAQRKILSPLKKRATKYKISLEVLQALLAQGKCEICAVATNRLVVDHSHRTGRVRGALCYKCNLFVGLVETSPAGCLGRLLEYLDRDYGAGQAKEAMERQGK